MGLLSLELLSAIFTLLNVHTGDVSGYIIKFEAFTADDSRSCIYDSFPSEKRYKEAFELPCVCFKCYLKRIRKKNSR